MSEQNSAESPLRDQIIERVKEVFDPEIPVNIWELGLIYDVAVDAEKRFAKITMTLTSPNCPSAQELPLEVQEKAMSVEGIDDADVEVVWDPTWTPEMMTEAAKLELGFL